MSIPSSRAQGRRPGRVVNPHPYRRWEAAVGALAAAALYLPLDHRITPGPNWVPGAAVVGFLIPIILLQEARRRPGGWQPSPMIIRVLALCMLAALAVAEASTLLLLILQLPIITQGKLLFQSGGLIWLINTLVFALAYWELDGGGPSRRPPAGCPPTDFLFPQQTDPRLTASWSPEYIDYLFLAFNTGTAFSPTDTMVLSREAKVTMMAQASIALLTIGLILARGVNIIA